ncbi:hypothetical protein [Natronomonas amylolytica]|uniref:hypothetical protein n=1 Tax=Natronomonas amylolytica TaxID=3108498 RepID=UPI00300920BD
MLTRRQLLAGTAAATAATAGCLGFGEEREVTSTYYYGVDVNPTAPVSDVTLYLPVPVRDGESAFSEAVTGEGIRPEEWSYAVVDTERGPMLEIGIDELQPESRPFNIDLDVASEDEIDTRKPLENEPTLQPKADLQQVDCDFPHPDEWDDRLRCYTYEGALYGTYEPTGTEVSLAARFTGENTWFTGGWNGNDYTDDVHGFVDGTGWTTARGSVRAGVGNY